MRPSIDLNDIVPADRPATDNVLAGGCETDGIYPRRLVFFVTEDWAFCSHQMPLALAARSAGYEVIVITRVRRHGDLICRAGFRLIPFEMARSGKNPLSELAHVWRLRHIYRSLQPDIVHHRAMKPVLYGTVAARLAQVPRVVNALVGLGFIFSSRGLYARLLRPIIRAMLRKLLRYSTVIVQNPDDSMIVRALGVSDKHVHMVRGSGVDLERFCVEPEMEGMPVVVLATRMLRDKGVLEFVAAARLLQAAGVRARFVLVGDTDPDNPTAISSKQLSEWKEEMTVEWWGHREDMPKVFAGCHIVCLPSYREGLPKVLIEAAACGRPIVTTDVPGCREIVRHGENGLLVPPCDAQALAKALHFLILSKETRQRMGGCGRKLVEKGFSTETIVNEILKLYRSLWD